MATFTSVLLTVTIFLAASNAAPNNNKKLPLKIPDACKGKGFCAIKPEGYDELQELITSLLTPKILAQKMGDRNGEVKKETLSPREDWHNCPYITKTEESLWAYSHSDNSDPDYIIQHELLRQPIEMVTCAYAEIQTNSSQQCFQHLGLGDLQLNTSCKSSTAKHNLIVLDYKTNQLKSKPFDVPCCCSCQIHFSPEK